ncbi:MAG: exodeoxyribonuclease VII large subunit [Clostridia bacterium]|nr:exodeoxyribonuclease VII large subunit [Clostridia bacterium]
MENRAITVTQLNNYIKGILENIPPLRDIYVKGEISNYSPNRTGHVFFTLKDEGSLIPAVMFKYDLSQITFKPENGMKVICRGRISAYPAQGKYQLYVSEMTPDGVGSLYIAFEQLKAKLAEEGLFDERYKNPIPKIPHRIGIITAPTGAAVRDMITVTGRRFPAAEIRLYPSLVQGENAPADLIKALDYFDKEGKCDVIIIGRGGGSIEDLWAFNNEALARRIFSCRIPVISAVGHETDFTIADFVADKRAPTPSAAAEIAVPDANDTKRQLLNVSKRMESILNMNIKDRRVRVKELASSRAMTVPRSAIDEKRLALSALDNRMCRTADGILHRAGVKKNTLGAKLESLNPLAILARGYGAAFDKDGKVIKSISQINSGEVFTLRLSDGEMEAIKK